MKLFATRQAELDLRSAAVVDIEAQRHDRKTLGRSLAHQLIDLGSSHALSAILLWHYHSQARVYRDVVVQLSDDPAFKAGVTTVFNNDHDNSAKLGVGPDKEYIEVAEGRLIDPKGVKGRYVRLYSNGNTTNDLNHYVEVEVYGSPK